MIHKDFPGGLEDLQEYVMEVLDGIKDHCVRDAGDEEDTRWEYTYHQRLRSYDTSGVSDTVDQIETIARKLAKTPYSRRAQAITWKAWEDNDCYDPPCLQSIWCRLIAGEDDVMRLNTNIRFRSNDAYKAAFMNMFAFIQLQKQIAERIEELSGNHITLGRYVHQADSYHLYGSYFNEFEERFLGGLKRRSYSRNARSVMKISGTSCLKQCPASGKKHHKWGLTEPAASGGYVMRSHSRRDFIKSAALAAAGLAATRPASAQQASNSKPNILLLMTDPASRRLPWL